MATEIDEVRFTAQEAKRTAEAAHDMARAVSEHFGTISTSIEALRRDNSDQHRENGKILKEGLDLVHQRISSVKKTQDDDRELTTIQIGALNKMIGDKAQELEKSIGNVRVESKEGDHSLKSEAQSTAIGFLWKLIVGALVLVAGFIGYATHGQLNFGG